MLSALWWQLFISAMCNWRNIGLFGILNSWTLTLLPFVLIVRLNIFSVIWNCMYKCYLYTTCAHFNFGYLSIFKVSFFISSKQEKQARRSTRKMQSIKPAPTSRILNRGQRKKESVRRKLPHFLWHSQMLRNHWDVLGKIKWNACTFAPLLLWCWALVDCCFIYTVHWMLASNCFITCLYQYTYRLSHSLPSPFSSGPRIASDMCTWYL